VLTAEQVAEKAARKAATEQATATVAASPEGFTLRAMLRLRRELLEAQGITVGVRK
jgi:hypothetical protein